MRIPSRPRRGAGGLKAIPDLVPPVSTPAPELIAEPVPALPKILSVSEIDQLIREKLARKLRGDSRAR